MADDTYLWAETYDRALDGIFATQSEIAAAVVSQLGVTLLPQERQGVAVRPTENLDAYQAYLRGQELLNTPDYPRHALELALQMSERAVELDPEFAAAYALLSRATRSFAGVYDPTPARWAKPLAAPSSWTRPPLRATRPSGCTTSSFFTTRRERWTS